MFGCLKLDHLQSIFDGALNALGYRQNVHCQQGLLHA